METAEHFTSSSSGAQPGAHAAEVFTEGRLAPVDGCTVEDAMLDNEPTAPATHQDDQTPIFPKILEPCDERVEPNESSKPVNDDAVKGVSASSANTTLDVGGALNQHANAAADATSRTICLRSLRATRMALPPSLAPSLDNWGALGRVAGESMKATVAAAAAALAGMDDEEVDSNAELRLAPPSVIVCREGDEAAISCGVPTLTNKVVDLRQVKKVRPGPLAPGPVSASASSSANGAPAYIESEGSEGSDVGGGVVKIDLSAGKRMIEFQLKQNAAEERREATKLRHEKETADAAAAKESERILARINARIEAQRHGAFAASERGNGAANGDRGEPTGTQRVYGIAEESLRELSEKHGILIKFVDDGDASGVAQVEALAKAHGICIRIIGKKSEGGDGVGRAVKRITPKPAPPGDVITPPPTLPSLRPRPGAMASKSTLRKASVKVDPVSSATTSNRGKTASGSAVQPPNAFNSGLKSVGNDKGSVASGGVCAATTTGRKRCYAVEEGIEVGKETGHRGDGSGEASDAKAKGKRTAVDVDASGRAEGTRPRGVKERLRSKDGAAREGASSASSGQDVAARMRAMPMANNKPKRMRLVSSDGAVVSRADSPVVPSARPSRRTTSGSTQWTPGNNLFKGAMAGITGRGKRPSPWRRGV